MFDRFSIVKLSIVPFEVVSVAKCFRLKGEFCDESFVKTKEQFGKHSIPILHFSNAKECETINESSKSEKALPHSRKDAFVKTE
jgi:hypothetical protein